MPAVMCTTMPPAKSRTPSSFSQPPLPQTQWQTGSYTTVAHSREKRQNALNLIRSANAPRMRPGVMTANIAWKIMNAVCGIVGA